MEQGAGSVGKDTTDGSSHLDSPSPSSPQSPSPAVTPLLPYLGLDTGRPTVCLTMSVFSKLPRAS
jgi:hypothetical protein